MTTITDKGGCQPTYVDESRQLIRKIRKPDRLHDFPDKEGVRGELDVGVMHLQLDSAATYST